MSENESPDRELEQRLRAVYEQRFERPPAIDHLWPALAPRLGAQRRTSPWQRARAWLATPAVLTRAGAVALAMLCLTLGLALAFSPAGQAAAHIAGKLPPVPQPPPTATPLPLPASSVLLIDPHRGELNTALLWVDSANGQIVRALGTRYTPDAVLSPDRKRLYVVDTYYTRGNRGESISALTVYDPDSGQILQDDIRVPGRLLYKVYPTFRTLFISPDGSTLYLLKYGENDDPNVVRVAALETVRFQQRWEVTLPNCGVPQLFLADAGHMIYAICSQGPILAMQAATGQVQASRQLSPRSGQPVNVIAAAAIEGRLIVATANGYLYDLEISGDRLDLVGDRAIPFPPRTRLVPGADAFSPRGDTFYVGLRSSLNESEASMVAAYDTASGQQRWLARLSGGALTLESSDDGRWLYTVSPDTRSLTTLDAQTGQEVRVARPIGESPARIIGGQ